MGKWQFTLRSFLLVITFVCIMLGFVVWRAERQRLAVQQILRLGGTVRYEDASDGELWIGAQVRRLLPRDYVDSVIQVELLNAQSVRDEDLRFIATFSELRALSLSHTQVTDQGLAHLKDLRNLKWLYLFGNPITDGGIAELQKELPTCTVQ